MKIIYPYIIDKDPILESYFDNYYYEFFWTSSSTKYFNESIFVHSDTIRTKQNKQQFVKFLFNPSKNRTYIILEDKFDYFINKYFSTKKIIERHPEFYLFKIPFPNIELEDIHDWSKNEYLGLSIAKNRANSMISTIRYRLKFANNGIYHEEKYCDCVYQAKLDYVYNLYKQYCEYLFMFLNVEGFIPIYKFIYPFYKITDEEFQLINEINSTQVDEIYKAQSEAAER